MKHFKNHIYCGRLATVYESRRCQMLEKPVLDGRTIQKIRDFVRNAGKKAAVKGLKKKNVAVPSQRANPNSISVQSPQSTNTSASSEPSSQTNPAIPSVIPSPATNFKPILFSQKANATTSTTLPPQATVSTISNVVHQYKTIIQVQVPHSADQTTAILPFTSQATNPSTIPASVVLPQTANKSISNTDKITIPQVADITNSSILILQEPNHTGSSVLHPQPSSLIFASVIVPQAANPTTYNELTPPAAKPGSSTQTVILKCANVPSPQGVDPAQIDTSSTSSKCV